MVVKGVYLKDNKAELYPDIGYSFCNCADIFYTRPENVYEPYVLIPDGKDVEILQPDPFFCEWANNPYLWTHWNPRRYEVLWDMHSLVEHLPGFGFEVLSYKRVFDVGSSHPQHFKIMARRK
jgi:hypothetical protein